MSHLKENRFHLKRSYQRHMGLAVLLASVGFCLGFYAIRFVPTQAESEKTIRVRSLVELMAPPSFILFDNEGLDGIVVDGVPDPVEKEDVSRFNWRTYRGKVSGVAYDLGIAGMRVGSDSLGWVQIGVPGTYQKVGLADGSNDRLPECFHVVLPTYPELAKGLEGEVWVHVLITEEGKAGGCRILRCSKTGVGFEESVMETVPLGRWHPARCNGKYVAMWVAYSVKFRRSV